MAERIVHLVEKELHQRSVEGDLEHRDDAGQRREVGRESVFVEPGDHQADVGVGHRDLALLRHSPALHERELGASVALLFHLEVAVDRRQLRIARLGGQRREAAGTDVLDPDQIGHEGLELRSLFGADRVRARGVPVDLRQRPLAFLDLGEHA